MKNKGAESNVVVRVGVRQSQVVTQHIAVLVVFSPAPTAGEGHSI